MLLEVKEVTKRFGGLVAVNQVSFTVERGQVFAVVGPNGSGKTTLFNVISGVLPCSGGHVFLEGTELTGRPSYDIAKLGVGRTFQNICIFRELSVEENVLVGRHCRTKATFLNSFFRPAWVREEEAANREKALEMLELVGLYTRRDELAKNLAYGEQKRLEIARAMATDPQVLLLDEPAAGLNTNEVRTLHSLIERIIGLGITILLIEHKMDLVLRVSDRLVVLNYGRKIAEGPPGEVAKNKDVVEAYLGKSEVSA
ncbi:MAG: ABC transporter ATP-binding protein [Firmicutes bacterium]|jgi:branched-chain amino acid transport system ATP-binding protein|nr:ABC transporter ATP-binding protein [Bacillota bacterium]